MVVVLVAEHVCSRAHVFEDDGSGFIGRKEREREVVCTVHFSANPMLPPLLTMVFIERRIESCCCYERL